MAALETQYKSAVASAIAENDYDRAKALMDEYSNQESRDAAMAKTLASYGDFSGYAKLYGDDAANNMAQYWIFQNPKLAYDMGRISAVDYARLTGQSSGSGSGSRGGKATGGKTLSEAFTDDKANNDTPEDNPQAIIAEGTDNVLGSLRDAVNGGLRSKAQAILDSALANKDAYTDDQLATMARMITAPGYVNGGLVNRPNLISIK